ncbi:MAG TPA: hypothetical protein VHY91_03190 [Pirellulales bacterium]|nr:hypothetical protein [Pirellulales bacterium]
MDAARRWNLAAWVAFAVVGIVYALVGSGTRVVILVIACTLPFFLLAAVAFYCQRASKRKPEGG